MRLPLLLGLALVAPLLAGCLAGDDVGTAVSDPAPLQAPAGTLRYDGEGTLLPYLPPVANETDNLTAPALPVPWYNLTGYPGAEPNVGITKSGAIFVTADDHVLRSRDRGATWEVVYSFGLEGKGAPIDPISNSDPMLWVDRDTDRVYADPMFPALACTTLAWSDDEGESWFERHGTCHPPPMDHQKLGGGKPGPDANPLAGKLHPSVLYHCYNMGVGTNCAASYDGGLNFLPPQVVMNRVTDGCGGLNGMPIVGPDGTAVVGSGGGCDGPMIAFTRDSGLTWTTAMGPTDVGAEINDPEIEFAPDGTLYLLWSGADYIPYVARTKDLGATWEGPWRVAPPGVTSTVFAAMVAGDQGKLAMAFLGTSEPGAKGKDPSDAPDAARWYLYVVTTDDADAALPTFTSHQVTPEEDPVQVGCVWMRGFPGAPCRNMLDFIDAAVHPDGTFFVAYTEGCTEGCAGKADAKPDDSRAQDIAIARLDGWILRTSAPEEAAEEG